MELFDIRDAVDAIITILMTDQNKWKPVYNLSSGNQHSLLEIAERLVLIASKHNGGKSSKIEIEESKINIEDGMDSSLFYNDMNWHPRFSFDETLESLIMKAAL